MHNNLELCIILKNRSTEIVNPVSYFHFVSIRAVFLSLSLLAVCSEMPRHMSLRISFVLSLHFGY